MASTQSIGSSTNPFPVSGSGRIQRLIGRNDTDGNGTLSLSEFETLRQTLPGASAGSAASAGSSAAAGTSAAGTSAADQFGQIDTDGDGQLSASELGAYRQKQRAAADSALLNLQEVFGGGEGGHAGRGVGRHHRPPADAPNGDATAATVAASASADASGSALDSLFARIDGDGNGAVSRNELSTFLVQAMSSITGGAGTGSATVDAGGPLATVTTKGTGV
jgi:Ca2+-binding EF-hand superfamily protein